MQMKNARNRAAISAVPIIGALFLLFSAELVQGQITEGPTKSVAPPFTCTNETLIGRFATKGGGSAPANPMDPTSPLVPFANVSLMTFDGAGGLTNATVNSNNGIIIPGSNPGNYELNADCTGTMTIAAPFGALTFYIVVGDRGKQFYMISTVPRSVVTVEGRRVQ